MSCSFLILRQTRLDPQSLKLQGAFLDWGVGKMFRPAFFKPKVPALADMLEGYFKHAKKSMDRANSSSPKFNCEQCKYLRHCLELAMKSAKLFLELLNKGYLQFPSLEDTANCLEVFKLLHVLASVVDNFVQSCSKDKDMWIQAAILMTNVSEHVSSIGFQLGLFTTLQVRRSLTMTEIDLIFKAEVEIVKDKASSDRKMLVKKMKEFLQTKKSTSMDEVYQLAELLLERLDEDLPRSSQTANLYKTNASNLKHVDRLLGEGGFGKVYKARWLGVDVAKKTFYAPNSPDFEQEVKILEGLSHPNIASLLCYAKDKRKSQIVMELMDGDLCQLMTKRLQGNEFGKREFPFEILEAIDIMLQIGEGMLYLHEMKIVHRDLKSMNILVRQMKACEMETEYLQVKVADFGLSKTKKSSMTYSNQTRNVGTTRWMAPEVISKPVDAKIQGEVTTDGNTKLMNYPFKSDIYSFGMVCYEILTGDIPFSKLSNEMVKEKILNGHHPELPNHCPPILKRLIKKCWSLDACKRPCFPDICAELRHFKYSLLMPCNDIIPIDKVPHITRSASSSSSRTKESNMQQAESLRWLTWRYNISSSSNSASKSSRALENRIPVPKKGKPWVIAIDFGTTYSGFAYARAVSDDPDIHVYYDWPSKRSERPYCKTLTGLFYKRTNPALLECAAWGYSARSDYLDHKSRKPKGQGFYFSRFKMLLMKDPKDPLLASIPSPLTRDVLITDYLKCIGEHALSVVHNHILLEHPEEEVANFGRDLVQWCVTVPSTWDENAKKQMMTCMVNTGLVSGGEDSSAIDAVKVVLEPEAASFSCHQILLQKRRDLSHMSLDVKDKILVADVGGGTVDIVVQELLESGDHAYKVKELTESSGGLCGGTFVDQNFMKFLSQKIGCLDEFVCKEDPTYETRLLKDWEEMKCAFGHEMIHDTDFGMTINLPNKLASKREAYETQRGNPVMDDASEVELTKQDLMSIFDPVAENILSLIADQLKQVPDIKVMFVVGGFAGSPYLMRRIRDRFAHEVTHIVSPPDPGSAVVRGAVSLAVLHADATVSRVLRKTYGISAHMAFDHDRDPTHLLEVTVDGVQYCKNRFDVFARKGSRVDVNQGVTYEYVPVSRGQTQMLFDLFSSTEQEPRYTEGSREGGFAITLPQEYNEDDMPVCKVTMFFGRSSIELRAEAQFKHGQAAEIIELPVAYYS